ncbi:MAG: NAD-dependent epimerase/dehydratase family protein [Gammaproteobacteria bacterium]
MNTKVKPFDSVVIVGFGDIGRRVAAIWQEKELNVSGLARSAESEQDMLAHNITPIRANLAEPDSLNNLPLQQALVYYFAPPPRHGQSDTHVENFLAAINENNLPARIVAISTSGVYGDCRGALVNEETPTNPQVDRARRRLDMEQQLRAWGRTLLPKPIVYTPMTLRRYVLLRPAKVWLITFIMSVMDVKAT